MSRKYISFSLSAVPPGQLEVECVMKDGYCVARRGVDRYVALDTGTTA